MRRRREDQPNTGVITPINYFEAVGSSGLKVSGGRIEEEFLYSLKGERGRKIYQEMADNDPTIGVMLFLIEALFKSIEWKIVPDTLKDEKSTPEQDELSDWMSGVLFDDMEHTFTEFISDLVTQFIFGWANFEIVYKIRGGSNTADKTKRSKYNDGKFGIRKLMLLGHNTLESWVFDTDGSLLGMRQRPYSTVDKRSSSLIFVPADKSILFRPKAYKNNPEGRSILRNCYRPWFFLKTIQEVEAIGVERDLNGLPVIYLPGEWLRSTDSNVKAAVDAYVKIVRDLKFNSQGGAVLPSDPFLDQDGKYTNTPQVQLKLLSTEGSRLVNTKELKTDYKMDILATCLMEFVMLGFAEKGAYSVSKSKSDLFFRAFRGWCNQICDVFNRYLFPKLWTLNGFPQDALVKLSYGDILPRDLQELGDFMQKLASAGMTLFPDAGLENTLREEAGLPERSDELDEELNSPSMENESQPEIEIEEEDEDIEE